jgi:hypothetical protein
MQAIKDFLSKINIRNVPLIGTLYATIDDLFDTPAGLLSVSALLITIGLAVTPAAHPVFTTSVIVTTIIFLVASFPSARL